jgi:hypothetical protein
VFAGFAMRKGQSKVTMIKDVVTVNGVQQTGSSSIAGLSFSNGGATVSYDSPDNCFSFFSTKNVLGAGVAPGYYHDMNLEMGSSLASSEGICGSVAGRANVDERDSLFSDAEANQLCTLCGLPSNCARRLSTERRLTDEMETTAETVCQEANMSYAGAFAKCQALENEPAYLNACIFDYCASNGDDAFVRSSAEAAARSKERTQNKTIVSTPENPVSSSSAMPVSFLLLCVAVAVFSS